MPNKQKQTKTHEHLETRSKQNTNKTQEPETGMRNRDSFSINPKHSNCWENSAFHKKQKETSTNKHKTNTSKQTK